MKMEAANIILISLLEIGNSYDSFRVIEKVLGY